MRGGNKRKKGERNKGIKKNKGKEKGNKVKE